LIGQAPSKLTNNYPGRPAFSGLCGRFLAIICGVSLEEFHLRVECVNLLQEWPGRTGLKGDDFPMEKAMENAKRMWPRMVDRRVLIAGRSVAAAFNLPSDFRFLETRIINDCTLTLLPHPSAVNIWWNSMRNYREAQRILKRTVFGEKESQKKENAK
jgi:hypothetical protein